jgi:hypothetical protein
MKREYWINNKTRKVRPYRNYIHIRFPGEGKALCGRPLDPDFDSDQAEHWEKTDKPNRRKICKQCLNVSKKIKDPRDEIIKGSLKTVSKKEEPIIEEEKDYETIDYRDFYSAAVDIMASARSVLKLTLEDLETSPLEDHEFLIGRMVRIKQFIAAVQNLQDNREDDE